MILLDTDHISLLQAREIPSAFALQARLEVFPPDEVVTTVIALEKPMRGWLALIRRVQDIQRQVVYYERLLSLIVFFAVWEVLPFDQPAAASFAWLRQRVRIGTMDLKIAAIALEHNALVLSGNWRDFQRKAVGLQSPCPPLEITPWEGHLHTLTEQLNDGRIARSLFQTS